MRPRRLMHITAAGGYEISVDIINGGRYGFEEKIPVEALYDWNRITKLLAEQKPWWKPGTKIGYHMITFGYLLGLDVLKASKFSEHIKLLAINEYTGALNYLIQGQIIEEYMEHHNITMSLEQYLNIAELQRARVFEKSTKIGAILARGNIHYQIKPLSEAMLRIGQAYAIRDDILDLENDIIGKKRKFIYILAVQNTDEEQSRALNEVFRKKEPLNKDDINKVADIYTQTNALIIAEQFAKNLIEQSKNYLKDIYPDLNKNQKAFFNEFSDYIYLREF